MILDLLKQSRSYRRFDQSVTLSEEGLKALVGVATLCPSPKNRQPLRFKLVSEEGEKEKLFPLLKWAGYLKDWPGPEKGERPGGYLIFLGDRRLSRSFHFDVGIVAQSMLLKATEEGYGGCVIHALNRRKLRQEFGIGPEYNILIVLALGKPVEEVQLEELKPGSSPAYWRDEDGVHHVPKLGVGDLLV